MKKTLVKKSVHLKNLNFKEYRQMTFAQNSIIIRKNQSFRHVYLIKTGQAAIYSETDPNQLIHKYKQGDYLNPIELCMSVNSFKTIKAISRCQILLLIWNKQHQNEEKKNNFIPKMQNLKFYEIPIFKKLSYALMLELVLQFRKQSVNKKQIASFFKDKTDSTCFLVHGSLTLQSLPKKVQEGLRRSMSCQSKQSRSSLLKQKHLKLVKFQKGQLLFQDTQQKYQYVCQTQICQIIYINTSLLYQTLDAQSCQRIKEVKQTQKLNLVQRKSKTYTALKSMTQSINRQNFKSQLIPQKFKNQIQIKYQKFQKARYLHYTKNNRNFRSYSDEKRKIINQRDMGYKKISELNRRKYGRDYIYEKRMEISKNIHGDNFTPNQDQQIRNSESDPAFKRVVTVYESATMKDDYGIMKQSLLMKYIRSSRSRQRKNYTSHNSSAAKRSKNDQQIQNLTLESVENIR